MSENLAKVGENSAKKAQSQGMVGEFVQSGKFDCGSSTNCGDVEIQSQLIIRWTRSLFSRSQIIV